MQLTNEIVRYITNCIINIIFWDQLILDISAWNGRSPSRQMRLISYSGDQKLLQIR